MASKSLVSITPEGFDIANTYLEFGSASRAAEELNIPEHEVIQFLKRKDVKDYIDGVYLDTGYRNRNKLANLLDKMIDSKVEEAEESEIYTNKDLFDLITLAHKMRMDELKQEGPQIINNVANFGDGNYGDLMRDLLSDKTDK